MEDRRTPVLYLERTDGAERAGDLAALPGVRRVTVWDNVVPGRTDLPRRLDEHPVLIVAEADATFAAPGDGGGLEFRATDRPGQGRLSGEPTTGLSLVLISPRTEAGAQSLRDWADFVHISHIAAAGVPGYGMITPYEHAGGPGATPRWLHFYEIGGEDPEASFQAMTPLVASRLGGSDTPAFREWAWHPELVIEYVNTFRLRGMQPGGGGNPR